MATRKQLLIVLTCSLGAWVASSTISGPGGGTDTADLQWSGTVTVTRRATGSLRSDDGKGSLGFTGSETVTFQLGADGIASYNATFNSNVDYAGQYSVPTLGTGNGTTYYAIGYN